jgi:pimeloyl-ACP methyl ester carboxylesterase
VAFIALACAAVLPYDQVKASAELTGGSGSDKPFPSKEQIAERLQSTGPSGSDPKPHLEQLRIPARWLYGTADREIPVDQSVALLNALKSQDEDFTVVTFPDSGHGLLHSLPPTPSTDDLRRVGGKEDPQGKPSVRSSGR